MNSDQITIHIDGQTISATSGSTILQAARSVGIDIPTLCHNDVCKPGNSCMVCLVKVHGRNGFAPACATEIGHEMRIDSQTDEIRYLRRKALEMLLSEHLGDCMGPCQVACPADMDIPAMLRAVAKGDMVEAANVVLADIPLPAILGKICPAPCEKICRHKALGMPIDICKIKGNIGEYVLKNPIPTEKPMKNGRKIAIIGAGPAGLTASWYLSKAGCQVTIFDKKAQAGGGLLEIPADKLPVELRDAEIKLVLGDIELKTGELGKDLDINDLARQYDAVLLATGPGSGQILETCGLSEPAHAGRAVHIDPQSQYLVGNPKLSNVFVAGGIIQTGKMAVRAVAAGHRAAVAIGQMFAGQRISGPAKAFNIKIGKMSESELAEMLKLRDSLSHGVNAAYAGPNNKNAGNGQASDCLHCDCRAAQKCRLRTNSAALDAKPDSYRHAERKTYAVTLAPSNGLIYEPGKCVKCGLCIQVSAAADPGKSLSFTDRGYNTRVVAPLQMTFDELPQKMIDEIVAICPTGAMSSV